MSEPITTVLGRVQPLYKGNYVHGTEYNYLDNVFYQGNTYVSLVNGNINHYPTESTYWQIIAAKGDRGDQGYTGDFGTPSATASRLPTGSNPSVNISVDPDSPPEAKVFNFQFGIPDGPFGFDGIDAEAESLGAGTSPSVQAELDTTTDERVLKFRFGIPAADGQGAQFVDGIGADTNNNVNLSAVRYVYQQGLNDTQKTIARNNIDALKEPANKDYGSFLRYAGDVGNPSWIAEPILQVPNGGTAGYVLRKQVNSYGWTPAYEVPSGGDAGAVLVKNSNTDYDFGWTGTITNEDINDIISD